MLFDKVKNAQKQRNLAHFLSAPPLTIWGSVLGVKLAINLFFPHFYAFEPKKSPHICQ